MFTLPYSSLNKKGIRDAVTKTRMGRYVLLYLHYGTDNDTYLFKYYGIDINNALGSDFALLSSYDAEVVNDCYMGKDEITAFHKGMLTKTKDQAVGVHNYTVMQKFAEEYKIKEDKMPALVVVDTSRWNELAEDYYTVSLYKKVPSEIRDTILDVINVLRENYNDFGAIGKQLAHYGTHWETSQTLLSDKSDTDYSVLNAFDAIFDDCNVSRKTLAGNLGITERTLYRYTHGESPIPRDTLLIMALILHLDPYRLDQLLDLLRFARMDYMHARDKIIMDCLGYGCTVAQTNQRLTDNNLQPLKV